MSSRITAMISMRPPCARAHGPLVQRSAWILLPYSLPGTIILHLAAGGAIRTLTLFFLLWHALSDGGGTPESEVPQLVVVLHAHREVPGSIPCSCNIFGFAFLVFYVSACYPQFVFGFFLFWFGLCLHVTPSGYPPTAIGYPPTAIGYPPTAIVGRIGHSEFFFLLGHPLPGGKGARACRQLKGPSPNPSSSSKCNLVADVMCVWMVWCCVLCRRRCYQKAKATHEYK